MLKVGIVGLPNVGKSTLFNALTRTHMAEAANYPFCTIEPNVGMVKVPDERLAVLAHMVGTEKIVPAAIEFVDIAGLVKGASDGEGLGNRFLGHIRETDAIVQVVRCFEDADIVHSMDTVDPVRDMEVIHTELILADLQSVEKQLETWAKKAKSGEPEAIAMHQLLQRLQQHLNNAQPASTLPLQEDDCLRMQHLCLLTQKPMLYLCNVNEEDLVTQGANNQYVQAVRAKLCDSHAMVLASVRLEEELLGLSEQEAGDYLRTLGVNDSGVNVLIQTAYRLLGLGSYFTAGPKEVHAWTFRLGMKAPECAGIIHTDFQRGFIRAEVVAYADFVASGGFSRAREQGKVRLEGKDYVFQEGDIVEFHFNVTR